MELYENLKFAWKLYLLSFAKLQKRLKPCLLILFLIVQSTFVSHLRDFGLNRNFTNILQRQQRKDTWLYLIKTSLFNNLSLENDNCWKKLAEIIETVKELHKNPNSTLWFPVTSVKHCMITFARCPAVYNFFSYLRHDNSSLSSCLLTLHNFIMSNATGAFKM